MKNGMHQDDDALVVVTCADVDADVGVGLFVVVDKIGKC